jgi:HAD superfamily hydrolase (TIGR01484 family)
MQPLREWPNESLRRTKAILCDIDDTLTWQGQLPAVAYAALERLRQSGLIVIPITGRPAGWCDHIARMWPVDGVVGENGAFYFRYDAPLRKMIRRYWRSDQERIDDRTRLVAIMDRVLTEVPGAAVAADQAYREADLAIDFCEDVPALAMTEVERIVEIFEQEGATAKISSIHVNGWFGRYDKLAMTRRMLEDVFSIDCDADAAAIVFVGDSPNDAPMFEFFPNAVGVANVKDFGERLNSSPRWVTAEPGGFGFAEFADTLLRARD